MFVVLSKVGWYFAAPSTLLCMLALLGALLAGLGFRRWAWLGAGASAALLLIGLTPIPNLVMWPLEERFPPWSAASGPPDGIIVLGGSFQTDVAGSRRVPALNEAAERMTELLALARRFPNARLVFTGGYGGLAGWFSSTEAEAAEQLLAEIGFEPSRVLFERRSRTTDENAAFTRDLVKPKPEERWLLVTSAYHMPRSIATLRAAGFNVEAYPVDYRTTRDAMSVLSTTAAGLQRFDTAVREWVGLLAYWLAGRSSELFPSPASGSASR